MLTAPVALRARLSTLVFHVPQRPSVGGGGEGDGKRGGSVLAGGRGTAAMSSPRGPNNALLATTAAAAAAHCGLYGSRVAQRRCCRRYVECGRVAGIARCNRWTDVAAGFSVRLGDRDVGTGTVGRASRGFGNGYICLSCVWPSRSGSRERAWTAPPSG